MSATAPAQPMRTLNRTELATFHGVSQPTVDEWIRRGCPAIARGNKGKAWKFDSAAVINWRLEEAKIDAKAGISDPSGVMSKEEADRRRAVALARSAEIEVDERLKSVALVSDVKADLTDFCTSLHTGLGNASNKIAGRAASMTSAPEIEDLCHAELNRAFESARAALAERWAKGA